MGCAPADEGALEEEFTGITSEQADSAALLAPCNAEAGRELGWPKSSGGRARGAGDPAVSQQLGPVVAQAGGHRLVQSYWP